MKQYLDSMELILNSGHPKADRTGTGTLSLFGLQMRFNILREGFPLLTTKKLHTKSIFHELIWFLKGDTNTKYLNDNGVTIWDEWADANGDLGPVYGEQWRSWPAARHIGACYGDLGGDTYVEHIDQIGQIIQQLRTNPDDRRIIVSAWNVGDVQDMALPPCHLLFQFYSHNLSLPDRMIWRMRSVGKHGDAVRHALFDDMTIRSQREREAMHLQLDGELIPRRGLSCQLYQRSCDWFLGVPFNIASYAALTMMVAQVTRQVPYEFVWTGGDVHLYLTHLDQARLQLDREPTELPWLDVNGTVKEIDDFVFEDLKVIGYDAQPHIKAKVAV